MKPIMLMIGMATCAHLALATTADKAASANNRFGVKLLKDINSRAKADANQFISPISAYQALSMVTNGAVDVAEKELMELLEMPTASREELNKANQDLAFTLQKPSHAKFTAANSIWLREGFGLRTEYTNRVANYYKAQANERDFEAEATLKEINDWASKETNGKIEKVLSEIPKNKAFYLMNATYFKGDWTHEFNLGTYEWDFKLASGATKKAQLMSVEANFRYEQTADYEAIELPYGPQGKEGKTSSIVILPKGDASKLLASWDNDSWSKAYSSLMSQKKGLGMVKLPKFKIPQYEVNLKESLEELGVKEIFHSAYALGDMTTRGVVVDEARQISYLAVTEKGTEAAAVTIIGGITAVPVYDFNLTVDRPFIFTIVDNESQALLFIGLVQNPEWTN